MQIDFEYTPEDFDEAARRPSPVRPGRATMTGLLLALAVINVVGFAANWLLIDPGLPAGGSARDYAPWVVVFGVVWVVAFVVLRRGQSSEWKDMVGAGRRVAVQVLPDRLVTWDEELRAAHAWAGFAAFRETKNLIVLYPRDTSLRYIAKRAVPDATQFEWLRTFLRQVIGRAL